MFIGSKNTMEVIQMIKKKRHLRKQLTKLNLTDILNRSTNTLNRPNQSVILDNSVMSEHHRISQSSARELVVRCSTATLHSLID